MTAPGSRLPGGLPSRAREIAELTVHCAFDTALAHKASTLKAQGYGHEDARQLLLPDVRTAASLIGIDAQDVQETVCGGLLRAEGFRPAFPPSPRRTP